MIGVYSKLLSYRVSVNKGGVSEMQRIRTSFALYVSRGEIQYRSTSHSVLFLCKIVAILTFCS